MLGFTMCNHATEIQYILTITQMFVDDFCVSLESICMKVLNSYFCTFFEFSKLCSYTSDLAMGSWRGQLSLFSPA